MISCCFSLTGNLIMPLLVALLPHSSISLLSWKRWHTHSSLLMRHKTGLFKKPKPKNLRQQFSGTRSCGQKLKSNTSVIMQTRLILMSPFVRLEDQRGAASFSLGPIHTYERQRTASGSSKHVVFSNSMQMWLTSAVVYSTTAAEICMETSDNVKKKRQTN